MLLPVASCDPDRFISGQNSGPQKWRPAAGASNVATRKGVTGTGDVTNTLLSLSMNVSQLGTSQQKPVAAVLD